MLNLFRSDFYKILKSKSLKVCWLIVIVLAALIPVLNNAMKEQMQSAAGAPNGYIAPILDGFHTIFSGFSDGSGNIIIILAILTAIFISSEFTNGTMKNIASKSFSRTQIYLSKLFVILSVNAIILITYVAATTITATILWGFGTVPSNGAVSVLKLLGLELLLFSGLTALFTMIGMLIRNVGGSIAVNICIYMFASLILSLLQHFIFKDTEIIKYWIVNNIVNSSALDLTSETIKISLVNGFGFLIIPSIIGGYIFNKNDIK